jgi:hypothetical protein
MATFVQSVEKNKVVNPSIEGDHIKEILEATHQAKTMGAKQKSPDKNDDFRSKYARGEDKENGRGISN